VDRIQWLASLKVGDMVAWKYRSSPTHTRGKIVSVSPSRRNIRIQRCSNSLSEPSYVEANKDGRIGKGIGCILIEPITAVVEEGILRNKKQTTIYSLLVDQGQLNDHWTTEVLDQILAILQRG
jgi:hypothetical protein